MLRRSLPRQELIAAAGKPLGLTTVAGLARPGLGIASSHALPAEATLLPQRLAR